MKDMITPENPNCPFAFNFDPATFKVGDVVSYRVPDMSGDMPMVGIIEAVHEDHIVISPHGSFLVGVSFRATRESRPIVRGDDIKLFLPAS